jgi:hypothetical protein
MITAVANTGDGKRIVMLGVTPENIIRLTAGQPIRVSAEHHAGFPTDLVIMITFGESERWLVDQMKGLITADTKVVGVPRTPGEPS